MYEAFDMRREGSDERVVCQADAHVVEKNSVPQNSSRRALFCALRSF